MLMRSRELSAWFTWFSAHGDTSVLNLLSLFPESQPRLVPRQKQKGKSQGSVLASRQLPGQPCILYLSKSKGNRVGAWGIGF